MLINGKEYRLVPVEPTERMIIDGFESAPSLGFSTDEEWAKYQALTGCQQSAYRARLCWTAMLAAAPTPPEAAEVVQYAQDAAMFRWLCEQQDVTWQTDQGQWHGGAGSDMRFIIGAAIAAGGKDG